MPKPIFLSVDQPQAIRNALNVYQSELRKPSYVIYCVDISGSMGYGTNKPIVAVYNGLATLFRQSLAEPLLLQGGTEEVTTVVPFNDYVVSAEIARNRGRAVGPAKLEDLYKRVCRIQPAGQTDIYGALLRTIEIWEQDAPHDHQSCSIVLLTDGVQEGEGPLRKMPEAKRKLEEKGASTNNCARPTCRFSALRSARPLTTAGKRAKRSWCNPSRN